MSDPKITLKQVVANQAKHEERDAKRFLSIQTSIDAMAGQLDTIHKFFSDQNAVSVYKVNFKKTIIWILSAAVAALTIITLLLQIASKFK